MNRGQGKAWLQSLLLLLLLCVMEAARSGYSIELLTLFAADGAASWHDDQVIAPGGNLAASGLVGVQFSAETDANGDHTWVWTLSNVSGAAIGSLRFTSFLDVDLSAPDNTFFKEYGGLLALGASAGQIVADRWEVGEPGYLSGDLLRRAANGDLSNSTATAVALHDDVAWALSLPVTDWAVDEVLTITVTLRGAGAQGLWQQDFDDGSRRVFQMVASKRQTRPTTDDVDYAVHKEALAPLVTVGDRTGFRITVTNNGPDDGSGVRISDVLPAGFANVQWTCSAEGGASCGAGSGAGDIDLTALIPAGSGHGVSVLVQGDAVVAGRIENTVRIAPLNSDSSDGNAGNNRSVAEIAVQLPGNTGHVDLSMNKAADAVQVEVDEAIGYRLRVANLGSESVRGAVIEDIVPAQIEGVSWSCRSLAAGASCSAASGSGNVIRLQGDLPPQGQLEIRVVGRAAVVGQVINQARVRPPAGVVDSDSNNNAATAAVQITRNARPAVAAPIPGMGPGGQLMLGGMLLLFAGWGLRKRVSGALALLALSLGLLPMHEARAIFENGDFEAGSWRGWAVGHGLNAGLRGAPPFTEASIQVVPGGVELLDVGVAGMDPRAAHLVLPRQGNFSLRINDEKGGGHLNHISQRGVIGEADRDPADGKLHVRFSYAAVLEDPGHQPQVQPFFHVYLKDLESGETLYDDFAYSNQPGRVYFVSNYRGARWLSTPFIEVDMVVPESSLGHELEIRALAADCSLGGHGGYVYVDAFGSLAIPPQGACVHDLKARGKPGKIQLTWSDSGASGYAVYRSESLQGPFVKLGETGSNYSTWLDQQVQPERSYYYSVRALDADGHEICSSGESVGVAPGFWDPAGPLNRAPYFSSVPPLQGDVRSPYVYQPQLGDADGDALSFVLHRGPVGMELDAATGALRWQPTATGDFRVNLEVSDGHGHRANQAFAIHVGDSNRAPVIGNAMPSRVAAGVQFVHRVEASDPDGDELIYSVGSQAEGMDIYPDGRLVWPDPQPGVYPLTLVVSDVHGARARQQVVVSVEAFPEFVSVPVLSATAGEPYSYRAQATDRDGDPVRYAVEEGPSGLRIDADSGVLQWTASEIGSFRVKLSASDPNGNTGYQSYSLRVRNLPNRAPVFTSTPVTHVVYPRIYSYQARADDADGDNLLWSLLEGPPGMEITAAGQVSWRFDSSISGRFPIGIEVDDQRGGVTRQSYVLQVGVSNNAPPRISSAPATRTTAGTRYRYSISASDPDGDALSYVLLEGPAGMTLTDNTLVWLSTEADVGLHPVQIQVSDGAGNQVSQSWTLEVVPAGMNHPPGITSLPVVTAVPGGTYVYQLQANDPDGDSLFYALPTAPAGMGIDADGGIEWPVPADASGAYPVVIEVSDGRGGVVQQSYAIGVGMAGNRAPRITSNPGLNAQVGRLYAYQLSASDADGDALSYTLERAPTGMSVSASGRVQWTPATGQHGLHDVRIVVSDGRGGSAVQSYVLHVQLADNRAPVITSVPLQRIPPGVPYTYRIIATDVDNDPLSYSLEQGPAGMVMSADTGVLNWVDPVGGAHTVEVRVADPQGAYASQTYTLHVSSNAAPVINSTPVTSAQVGVPYNYQVLASDADGDFLTYVLKNAPPGFAVSDTGLITGTPGSIGTAVLRVIVSDGQASAVQEWTLRIQPAPEPEPLSAEVSASPRFIEPGQSTTLSLLIQGGHAPYTVSSFRINGSAQTLDANNSMLYTPPTAGRYNVQAQVRDARHAQVTVNYWFAVKDPADATPPVAEITAPGRSDTIDVADVSSLADIIGTASDVNLGEWRLLISESGKSRWSLLSSGSASVVSGRLGGVNPQVLSNGLYDIGLIVTDLSGNEASARITLAVEGEQKTAPLQLTFEDLRFEIEGLPLGVRRTYDSLKRLQSLDFGYGWSVDYQDVWLQTNGVLGRSWVQQEESSGFNRRICVRPQGKRVASIRLPDGRLERFILRASPECASALGWGGYVTALEFVPHPRNASGSRLEALGHADLRVVGGDLVDVGSGEALDPEHYRLILLDGTEYTLDRDFGIRQIKDRNGNSLQFGPDGISHSGGWSLQFARDAQGRITQITAPGDKTVRYSYDSRGDLASMSDETGAESRYVYSASLPHALTEYSDPLGRLQLRTEYDAEGRITRQTDAAGNAITIRTDVDENRQRIRDRNGNESIYEYDERGNVTQVTDAAGGITQYVYDAHDNEIEVTDPLGRKTTRSFDAYGNITSETDAAGRRTETEYNPQGQVTRLTDAAGRVTQNAWNASGNLTGITNPLGQSTQLAYTGQGSLSRLTDAAGHQTSYSYARINGTTLKQSETAPDGTVTQYSYDDAGNLTTRRTQLTLSEGGTPVTVETHSSFDAKGRLLSQTDAQGHTSRYHYNAAGELTEETDALGRITRHSYNARGEKTETLHPDGLKDNWQYDGNGNETRSCTGAGSLCTATQYDALDRPIRVTDPAGHTTHSRYDAAGQLIEQIDARGHSTHFEYDEAGQQIAQTDALSRRSTRAYDLAGNLVQETNPAGERIEHSYNSANQRTSSTLPTGAVTQWAYNEVGQRISQTGPEGEVTQFAHDSLGRLSSVTDPLNHSTHYHYNEQGQLLAQTDAEGRRTGYGYDSAGRRVSRTLADGRSESLSYNAVGQLLQKTGFDSRRITWEYGSSGNQTGRLLKIHRPDGSRQELGYDAHGRLQSRQDSRDGNESQTLDALGRIIQHQITHSASQLPGSSAYVSSLHYQWDGNSNRTRLQINAPERRVEASFDAANQLQTLSSFEGAQASFTHDSAGRLSQISRSDGSTSRYQYNLAGQLTDIQHHDAQGNLLARFSYSLNRNGQRIGVSEEINATPRLQRQISWQYDAAGKLVEENIQQSQPSAQNLRISYQYDKVGNRLSKTISGSHNQSTTYHYDNTDRLIEEVDSQHGTTTYSYDINGNLSSKTRGQDITSYSWNSDNRLIQVQSGNKTVRYGYDPQGRRIKKLVNEGSNTTETHYIRDSERAYHEIVIERTRINSGPWRERSYLHTPGGVGELISESDGSASGTRQIYSDGQGSVRLSTEGSARQSWSYDAFGNLMPSSSDPISHSDGSSSHDPYNRAGQVRS